MKTLEELKNRQNAIHTELNGLEGRELNEQEKAQHAALLREWEANKREITLLNIEREAAAAAPKKTANQMLRETVKAVREGKVDGNFVLTREATSTITSGIIQVGEKTNMETAGIPVSIQDIIKPLDAELVYSKVGLKVQTGVRGKIQWPVLDNSIEVSVGGELDTVDTKVLEFDKITTTPYKLGISVEVSNEAINDEAFDLIGLITEQIGRGTGRTLNKRVLALSAPSVKADFVGPLVSHKQAVTFAGSVPTYAELKALKGKVLASNASMAGFCYIMDAAMYSSLEATPKDAGSGRFVIEGGKIDGDVIFLTDLTEYANKVVCGCFAYEALNQHGATNFIVDPYTQAKKNITVFTLNADWSLTYLVRPKDKAPFAVGSATV
ncbi:MAG: phage major capsid protein [Paludibacteraceae bacterium]|nr:phage major capsid protein [Paludibacteraceae bacterium]